VLAQATSPFTRASDVDELVALLGRGYDSALSAVAFRRFLWDRAGRPLNYDPAARPRRQDFAGAMLENGALYASTAGRIRATRTRISGRIAVLEMPEHTAVELDEPDDWVVAEALLARQLGLPAATSGAAP
jgi:N-acylneuraminate cytidylyltransferase